MGRPVTVSVFLLLLGLTGCAGNRAVPVEAGVKGAPDWVNQGSRAMAEKGGRVFRGVAQAPTMDDPSLQSSVADNRARGEVAVMVNRWLELAAGAYVDRSGQLNEAAVAQLLTGTLQGNRNVRIPARWRDKGTGVAWSSAEFDLRQLKATLAGARELSPDLKRWLDENAEALFARLMDEQGR